MKDDPSRLRQFEVVAYGCHKQAHEDFSQLLRSQAHQPHTYLLVEYFCTYPVPIWRVQDAWEHTTVFFPFIRRLVEENHFLWVSNDAEQEFKLCPKTADVLREFEDAAAFRLPVRYAKLGCVSACNIDPLNGGIGVQN